MFCASLLVLAAALNSVASCTQNAPLLSNLRDCYNCQLQKFNFTALNRYPTSQLGVLQLFKDVTFQYLLVEFRKLSNSTAMLRIRCNAGGDLDRCASAILVQEQASGMGRVFLQTICSTDSGSLSLENDWLQVAITEPSNKTWLFSLCDGSKVFWEIGVVQRTSELSAIMYRQLAETFPCWNYDEDLRSKWKTPCNISNERYHELAYEMRSVIWYGGESKRMKILVVAILIGTAIAAMGYIFLSKSFVRVSPML